MFPKLKARPRVRGRPRERPTDETWPGREPSIAHALMGSAASTDSWRNPGTSRTRQARESSRKKESQGKSRQAAPGGPPPYNQREFRSPTGGGPRPKESKDKGSQPTAPQKSPKEWRRPKVYKNKNVQLASGAATPPNPRKPRRPSDRPARGYRSGKGKRGLRPSPTRSPCHWDR